jgi:hypothetical protein
MTNGENCENTNVFCEEIGETGGGASNNSICTDHEADLLFIPSPSASGSPHSAGAGVSASATPPPRSGVDTWRAPAGPAPSQLNVVVLQPLVSGGTRSPSLATPPPATPSADLPLPGIVPPEFFCAACATKRSRIFCAKRRC